VIFGSVNQRNTIIYIVMLRRPAILLTYLLHYNNLVSDALCFGRLYCLHLCESGDISNLSYLPIYTVNEHHIKFPIFVVASISNLTFLTFSYRSWDYKDELVWGAVWLYRATNDNNYLNSAESLYDEFGLQYWNGNLGWDNKVTGVQVRYVKEFTFTVSLTNQ